MTKVQTHGVLLRPFNPLAVAIAAECSLVARSFTGDAAHLRAMMAAVLKHRGGFALLDILQPCPSFNHLNTFRWYRERVKPIPDTHDPGNRQQALELAFQWGDTIPIGIVYRHERPTFESRLPVLKAGTLVQQYGRAGG